MKCVDQHQKTRNTYSTITLEKVFKSNSKNVKYCNELSFPKKTKKWARRARTKAETRRNKQKIMKQKD